MTDFEYKVLALIREVKATDERKILGVGMPYDPFNYQRLTMPSEEVIQRYNKSIGQESIRNSLKSLFTNFGNEMIDFCLQKCDIERTEKASNVMAMIPSLISTAQELVKKIQSNTCGFSGFVKHSSSDPLRVCDFGPVIEDGSNSSMHFPTFNSAVDEYFYRLEEARNRDKQTQVENAVIKKFEAIRREQELRIKSLEENIEHFGFLADVIEVNLKLVEDAICVINTGLDNDMSWDDLDALVRAEKRKERPIALLIAELKLIEFKIKLELPYDDRQVNVDVDVRLSGHGNADRYYNLRKQAMDKLQRTKAAFQLAMKSAEAKVRADSQREKRRTQHLIPKRKILWFEKFNWFISSDSYLVLSGKDMHQNELLVKRLLRAGDAYVHADLTGASSVIVKNHRKPLNEASSPPLIPHRTLVEAGAFSLCFSRAWEAKIVTSAWWVYAHQVSKTAPSGEYLATGSFMIRGRKNFLPPSQLILGFGFMFLLDEDSTNKRRADRIAKEALREVEESIDVKEKKYLLQDASGDSSTEEMIITTVKELKLDEGLGKEKKLSRERNLDGSPSKEPKASSSRARGKHGKQKKLKEKYKHQDEEERKLRLKLLGSTGAKSEMVEEVKKVVPGSGKVVSGSRGIVPVSKAVLEGNSDMTEEDAVGMGELEYIDSLVGNPTPDENIIGIIATAAPFMVMQHYKYRVKLLPGNLKRGGAAKTAVALMLSENKATITQRDRDLIRSVTDTELNSTMPGKVRLAASGIELSKVKKAQKKKKK